ncbi:hypothetical protein EVAR_63723_1 [Eumeta japonica]|uniref:Uncharacterized protein n=1 Tax=Eumeta variegata TaxID=151549 RepID=A0A4C1ZYC4_EUMVA|nr:hypothetical protein EVAR_63723_1 [Eumeta japonica]
MRSVPRDGQPLTVAGHAASRQLRREMRSVPRDGQPLTVAGHAASRQLRREMRSEPRDGQPLTVAGHAASRQLRREMRSVPRDGKPLTVAGHSASPSAVWVRAVIEFAQTNFRDRIQVRHMPPPPNNRARVCSLDKHLLSFWLKAARKPAGSTLPSLSIQARTCTPSDNNTAFDISGLVLFSHCDWLKLSPSMDIRNPGELTSTLPASWVRVAHLMKKEAKAKPGITQVMMEKLEK